MRKPIKRKGKYGRNTQISVVDPKKDVLNIRSKLKYDDISYDDRENSLEIFDDAEINYDEDIEEEEVYHEEDDDDLEEDDDSDDIANLVENLPSKLRQKVLMGGIQEDSDSDHDNFDDNDNQLDHHRRWGKKKTYWSGDTADLEIGQDIEDAIDEENAVKDLEREKLNRMKESDFFDELSSKADNENANNGKTAKLKSHFENDIISIVSHADDALNNIESLSLGKNKNSVTHIENLSRNFSKLSKEEKLHLLSVESPELIALLNELKAKQEELNTRIIPIYKSITESIELRSKVQDDLVDYLDVKQQLLISYCLNITFYLYLKSQGCGVRIHPVMKQLLELRYAMEKMKPLDVKLRHQIDRLATLSSSKLTNQDITTDSLRPNLSALLDQEDESEKEEDGKLNGKILSKYDDAEDENFDETKLYKAPKMMSAVFEDSGKVHDKRLAKAEKKKRQLIGSDIMETLRDEFGTSPEVSSSSGVTSNQIQKQLELEEQERREYEEDRFVRMTLSRKDKKSIKRRIAESQNLQNLEDVGDIGDFDDIVDLNGSTSSVRGVGDVMMNSTKENKKSAGGNSLQQTLNAYVQLTTSRSNKMEQKLRLSDDSMPESRELSQKKTIKERSEIIEDDERSELPDFIDSKQQPIPGKELNYHASSDDTFPNLLEDFAKKKKEYLRRKKDHYSVDMKFAGHEDVISEGGIRGVTYEIMKNRGVTPYRKVENKNPRVKKRKAYERAVTARKGQVRDVIKGVAGSYGGELTGIKTNISRSRKF